MTTVHSPARAFTVRPTTWRRDQWLLPAAILITALVLTVGWLTFVAPARQDATGIAEQATTMSSQADALQRQLTVLQGQQADLPRYQAELQADQLALPTTSALPALLRSLQDIGTSNGVTVSSLTATPPVGANGAGSNGTTAGGTAGAVYRVPISITAAGSFDGLSGFLGALQREQPRAVLVTSFNQTADDSGATLTLTMVAFFVPQSSPVATGG